MNQAIGTVPRQSVARVDCMPKAPADWTKCAFRELAQVNPSYRLDSGGVYPFVEMASVAENFAGIKDFVPRQFQSGFSRFKENDTIFAKITPCAEHGKVALVKNLQGNFGTGSTEFIVLSPRENIIPEYLFYLASCPAVHTRAVSRMEGSTGRLRVSESTFTKWLWVAIPDRAEQTRVAETLKAADDHIQAIEQQIHKAERVKTAMLQSVFIGGLPGTQKTEQNFRWGKAPSDWSEVRVRSLLVEPVGNGISPHAARPEPPGIPTLNVSSIRRGICDTSAVSYIELSEELEQSFAVAEGDFFVLRGNGNRDYVAIGGLLESEPPLQLVFSDLLIRLRFDRQQVDPRFMKYLWQSPQFLRRLQSYAITGSGLWKIGQRSISRFELAVPTDLDEQKEIATLFDSSDSLLAKLTIQLTAARRVKQSLLQNLLTGKIRLTP